MKSEERQKQAKERREEKAKYLGEWELPDGWAEHIKRVAPPGVGWEGRGSCVAEDKLLCCSK